MPLRDTREKAVQRSIDAPRAATNLMMANQSTTWYILEMTFSAYKPLQFFQSGAFHRLEGGWRFYGDLPRSEAESWQWAKCTMPESGMMTWAWQALKSKLYSCSGSCIGCGATFVPVWTSNKVYGHQTYCCECWHSFFLEDKKSIYARTGIYEQMEHKVSNKCRTSIYAHPREDEQMEARN